MTPAPFVAFLGGDGIRRARSVLVELLFVVDLSPSALDDRQGDCAPGFLVFRESTHPTP